MQLESGNINLSTRPVVRNDDGSISTVRSMSVNIDDREVLIPTVSDDGRIMSADEAIATYKRTGRHLGKFDTPESATAYAEQLHAAQERQYSRAPDVLSIYPTRETGRPMTFADAGETTSFGEKLTSFLAASTALPAYLTYQIFQEPESYGGLIKSAERHQRLLETMFSEGGAREEAYERRIKAVRDATGIELENPERGGYSLSEKDLRRMTQEGGGPVDPMAYRRQRFEQLLAGVRADNPEKAAELQFGDIGDEARAIAKGAEDEYSRARQNPRLDPAAAFVVEFAGGLYGMRRDPVFMGSLVAGPTSAIGRTVGARIVSAGLIQGLYNAGLTALEQPAVQAWRAEVGVRSGAVPALENVGLAFLFGAIPGAVFRGAHELTVPARQAMERVLDGRPEPGDIDQVINMAQSVLGEIDAGMSRAARLGEAIDANAKATAVPPTKDVPEPLREDMEASALRNAEDPVNEPTPAGVAAASEPPPPPPKPKRGPAARSPDTWSLFEFIASRGGIRADDANIGDVRAILGKDNKFIPGFGPLVRKTGMQLDRLREAAVEAGYIEDVGFRSDRQATTTLRDLLDHMDREARGEKVYKQGSERFREQDRGRMLDQFERDLDAQLEAVEIPPGSVDAKLRKRTFQIMEREGVTDPLLAYEQAVMEDSTGVKRYREPVPGWSEPILDEPSPTPTGGRGDDGGGEAGPGAAAHEPREADRAAPQSTEISAAIAEAKPTSQREAQLAADEALDDIGRKEAIAIGQRVEGEAREARVAAAAEPIPPEAKAPKGDALGKVPWITPEGKSTTISEVSIAKLGARELEIAELIKACK